MNTLLDESGFITDTFEDASDMILNSPPPVSSASSVNAAPAVTPHAQLGLSVFVDNLSQKAGNARRSLQENQIRFVRGVLRSGLLVLAIPLLAHATLPQSESVPGGVATIQLANNSASAEAPQAWLGDQQVLVTSDHDQWYAVVGLPLDMTPGQHQLRIKIGDVIKMQDFTVNIKDYPEQHISLKDKSKVELSTADEARAEREIGAITELKHHWREAQNTDLDFILPVKGKLGSRFGLRRFFNEEPRLPHAGLDVAVARGTPVKASAQGVVLAAADYFFNGKTIFIDHGNGLLTMYCHLDHIDVKAGVAVRKGQRIGRSGMTGRATGPHLHWSVVLNGAMVNPELFIPDKHRHQ